jgi:hypothetical protein
LQRPKKYIPDLVTRTKLLLSLCHSTRTTNLAEP